MKRYVWIGMFLLAAWVGNAAVYTLNGYVSDATSGERLIGATVVDSISGFGAVTNSSGFYSLTLPQGKVRLQIRYVGYQPAVLPVFILENDSLMHYALEPATQLEEVTVVGHQSISAPQAVQMSAIEVPVQQIKGIPSLMGEVDVLKAIQLLPGVQSGTEGAAGLYVRGGGPDENLVLLDGVPLYNVNHLMGFFSVFNADAVKNVTLYKGNFPAMFGSRLSSVVDVRQNDGNLQSYHGNVTVGLLAAKVNVEGPIVKGKTSFSVSARRTYFDLFTAPIMAAIYASYGDGEKMSAGYYFYDVNAKVTHRFSDNDKLSASFYMGDDAVYYRYKYKDSYMGTMGNEQTKLRWNWGNLLASVDWEHRFNARIFSNTQLSFTRYRYHLGQTMDIKESGEEDYTYNQTLDFRSHIADLMLQTNFTYMMSPKNKLSWGANYTYHRFKPEVGSFQSKEDEAGNITEQDISLADAGILHAHEASVYIEDEYTPWRWLRLQGGLRGSLYSIGGKTYPSIEPRLGLRALIIPDLAFKASYAYMSQYIHLLSNSSISMPTDLWVPVTKQIEPMRSVQVAAGLSYDVLGQVELSVEGYYKYMKNLLEYRDGATYMASSTGWEDKVAMGNGWSYGVEFLAQRKVGPVTGWIAYTWSRAMRQFNKEGQMINFGKPFHAKYERQHDVSVTLQWQITPKIDISGTFVYGTGTRATLATQEYYEGLYNGYAYGDRTEYISERNNYTMPDYHRLDLGVNFHKPHKKWKNAEHIVNISVYNAYNNMNPFLLWPDRDGLIKITLFPILPSLSYTFSF